MSPHPATFRNGTCTGSLWKSHICCHRATSSGHNNQNNDNAANANASANDIGRGNDGNDDVPSFEGAVAEANERQQRTHHEFCVLVGNMLWSYTDVWAYVKGDPPTVREMIFTLSMIDACIPRDLMSPVDGMGRPGGA
jgi:hypothetical protein